MLQVRELSVKINTPNGITHAVNNISFQIEKGKTLGIVGESGSGKSVLASSFMRLNQEAIFSYPNGEILFENENVLHMSEKRLQQLRGNDIAMIFQDPMSSLNPVYKIGTQLVEAIRSHKKISKKIAQKKALQLIKDVGIADPERRLNEYPHQFSGGMLQRILIAMALAGEPKLLIADEPTTALDVTIQAQILDLLKEIQAKYGTSILIITHDLGIVANMADTIIVMYAGEIVEIGSPDDIFYHTKMPYTWSLFKSLPQMESKERLFAIKGNPPNLNKEISGCPFYKRCLFRMKECQTMKPELKHIKPGHQAACLLSPADFDMKKNDIHHQIGKEKV